jgi:polyphenol oxidase
MSLEQFELGFARCALSTRLGGQSGQGYASLNLGTHVGDDPAAVTANRAQVASEIKAPIAWLEQVHGVQVVEASAALAQVADAQITRQKGLALAVMVADCLPVLFASKDGSVIGCAHAGWRGLANGVLENTVLALQTPVSELLVYFGPCIGPRAFEVGEDVKSAFPLDGIAFTAKASGKYWAHLQQLAYLRLHRLGIAVEHMRQDERCTFFDDSLFFSHRRQQPTGRQAAFIWLPT